MLLSLKKPRFSCHRVAASSSFVFKPYILHTDLDYLLSGKDTGAGGEAA